MESWDPQPGKPDDYGSKAIVLWSLKCQVTELLLYPAESHFKLEHAKVKACAWKIYQVVMGRMDWEQSGLKPTAVVQHRIMKLLNWRAAARWERRFRAEEFQRKSWGS